VPFCHPATIELLQQALFLRKSTVFMVADMGVLLKNLQKAGVLLGATAMLSKPWLVWYEDGRKVSFT